MTLFAYKIGRLCLRLSQHRYFQDLLDSSRLRVLDLRVRGLGVRGLVLGLESPMIRCISSMHLKHPVHRIIFK